MHFWKGGAIIATVPKNTVGVDDAGGPPRVLADFAHWDQILRSALVSLRRSSFLQKAGLFGDHYSRTRKLSPVVPKIVPWRRGVKIGRCQHSIVSISYVKLLCGFTNHKHACFYVFMVLRIIKEELVARQVLFSLLINYLLWNKILITDKQDLFGQTIWQLNLSYIHIVPPKKWHKNKAVHFWTTLGVIEQTSIIKTL